MSPRPQLKARMFALGKSQRAVAHEGGLSEDRLSKIVLGWTDPRDDERAALCRILGCGPEVFEPQQRVGHPAAEFRG